MRTLFACDLDNTILIPGREARETDICAEVLNGNKQSFITPLERDMLRELVRLRDVIFLPVTTRSEEQYKRIELPVIPRCALICNGLSLLENGEISEDWERETEPLTSPHSSENERLLKKYKGAEWAASIRIIDGKFLFAACGNAKEAEKKRMELQRDTGLEIMLSGRKLYWFPPGTDKGTAVKRFAERNSCERIIAAGDSTIDLPMLDIADTALVPDAELAGQCVCSDTRVCGTERFPEFILTHAISEIRKQGMLK